MSTKTKARKSVTITITIASILFSCNTWDEYKIRYRDSLRQVEIENVERMRLCRTPQNGYKVYQCPECGTKKYVPFTCKSRLCTSCGTKAANQWAEKINHKLLKVPHRHVVFTIPETLRAGRSKTTKEMTKYGALLAVLSNLENEDYAKTVLDVVDDFVRELQNVIR